jgi:hypothetical protein
MNAAVIKIKYADPPKDGKKQATIKTDDNQIFGVWPKEFGLLQPGRTYKVEFSERPFQGKTYRTITKCEPVATEIPSGASQSPQSVSEAEFVTRLLAAGIKCGGVVHSEQSMIAEVTLLRSVYRNCFR